MSQLECMTVYELKTLAAKLGLMKYSKMRKYSLISLLRTACTNQIIRINKNAFELARVLDRDNMQCKDTKQVSIFEPNLLSLIRSYVK